MENSLQLLRATSVVPMLYLPNLAAGIEFYKAAFGAVVHWSVDHEGRVHVAELSIANAVFRMHEEYSKNSGRTPASLGGTTVVLNLIVTDPDAVAASAVAAGAKEVSPVQDYDYGYRQGTVIDPFGHHWQLEKGI